MKIKPIYEDREQKNLFNGYPKKFNNIKKKYSFLKFISLFIISFFLNSFLNIILKYNRKRLYNIMKSFSKIKR